MKIRQYGNKQKVTMEEIAFRSNQRKLDMLKFIKKAKLLKAKNEN
jgi:hypothetical protein